MMRTLPAKLAVLAIGLISPAAAQEFSEVQKAAILTTLIEAAVVNASAMRDRLDGAVEKMTLEWTARYSEREWSFEARGVAEMSTESRSISLQLSGFLWGAEQENLIGSYVGQGQLGEEPLRVYGQSDWIYSSENEYQDMNFNNVAKFGENSIWHWVLGAEILGGGTIGVGAGIIGGPLAGATAAVAAGTALVGASNAAKSIVSDEPPSPPSMPERPAAPADGEELEPSQGRILTVVAEDGQLFAVGPDELSVLDGKFDAEQGAAEGIVF